MALAKRNAAAKAKTATTPAEKKQRKPASNLVDAIDQATFDEKPQCKRRRRNLEEEVNKRLKDNFKCWNPALFDLVLVDGKSLRERVTEDTADFHAGVRTIPMGKYYYDGLRSTYGTSSDPATRLIVKDRSLPENQELFVAMKSVLKHARDYTPINALLQTAGKLDQKNLVALLKCCLRVSPLTSLESLNFVLNVMRYLARHSYQDSHGEEVSCMRAHFDTALDRSLNMWRNNERPVSEWWQSSQSFAKLVLDADKVDKILKTSALGEILDDLALICESGKTGAKMFSRAYSEAQFALVDSKMAKVLQSLDGQGEITAAMVQKNREDFAKEVASLGKSMSETYKPKEKQFVYLGFDFSMPVSSIIDEYELRVAAKLRSFAVAAGDLEPLWCELQLAGKGNSADPKVKVAPEFLQASARCRAACREFLDGKDVTGENIKQLFTSKFGFLRQMDKSFQIEMYYFLGCVGEVGNARIKSGILAALPSAKKHVTPQQALSSLVELEQSKLFEFSGLGVRSIFGSIKSMVESIANDRAPNLNDATDSAFFKSVKSGMLLFLRHTPVSKKSGSAGSQVMVGATALKAMYDQVSADKGAGKQVSLPTLRPLQVYAWALTEAQRTFVVEWVAQAVSSTHCSSPASEAAAKRRARKSQGSKQNTDDIVMSLFT